MRRACQLSLFTTLLCLVGCSVDEFRNVQRVKNCEECEQRDGTCIMDRYCLVEDHGAHDAGVDASIGVDAAPDDDAGGGDASVPTPCSEEGKVELCYSGDDPATAAQLPCRPGTRTCHDGVFGECQGEVVPQAEQCNSEDDDCDGRFDEGLGGQSECTIDDLQGRCAVGVQLCREGMLKCLQEHFPQSDVCNDVDDDCDGEVDEHTEVACYEASSGCQKNVSGDYECTGSCRAGTHACVDGEYEDACSGEVSPKAEDTCTGPGQASGDEDCDAEIDEGCECTNGTACYTGPEGTQTRAPCEVGAKVCSDATHGTCEGETTPGAEHCGNEGVDNDCDGVQDNIPFRNVLCADASEGRGACKAGARWQCVDDELQCVDAQPSPEVCDGRGVDENCNGMVDEGFDLMTDRNHCGACGVVCGTGLSCCGGQCVNVTSNNAHCSRCGNACASGAACCSNSCVNVLEDPNNCGTCGHVCSGVLKGCTNGVCTKLLL